MPDKNKIFGPLVIAGIDPKGQAFAEWFPYEDNTNPDLASKKAVLYFDARHNVPEDRIKARFIGKKSGEFQGLQSELLEPSPLRQEAPCEAFGLCGGCSFQRLAYEDQARIEEKNVKDYFSPLFSEEQFLPLLKAPEAYAYRNKMEFTASERAFIPENKSDETAKDKALGFFVPYSGNKVLSVSACLLQKAEANELLFWTQNWARERNWTFYNSKSHEGFFRTLLIRSNEKGELLVMPIFARDEQEEIQAYCQKIREVFPQVKSLWYLINEKLNDSYSDLSPQFFAGEPAIPEKILGLEYYVSPLTFLQVNTKQCEFLYGQILKTAQARTEDLVYDLYCGVGTISLLFASTVKKVCGLEYVEASVVHAREAASRNKLDNAHFFAGDMAQILDEAFFESQGRPNIIICDPPRAGMHPRVLKTLLKSEAKKIVYVSCNMISLKRDLEVLAEQYKLVSIQGIDLMPQTPHIETLVLLERKD